MRFTDERVKVMNEVISGMKVIKLYTWEDSFSELVGKIRTYVTLLSFERSMLLNKITSRALYLFLLSRIHISWKVREKNIKFFVGKTRIHAEPGKPGQ